MMETRVASKVAAAVYVRVSTSSQEKWSPEAQRRVLLDHCARMGWEPTIYSETGSGETLEGRPEIMRLLRDARGGRFTICLVIELERLSRDKDLFDWLTVKQTMRAAGVKIATPAQVYDLDDAEDDFMSDLFGVLSKREKQKMIQRVARGRAEAKARGAWLGEQLPYGWKAEGGKVVLDPEAEEGIRLILSMAKTHSGRVIAAELRKRGIKSKRGAAWGWAGVCRLLRNPALMGRMRYNDDFTDVPGYITEQEFQAIQAASTSRRTKPKYVRKHRYLLAGFAHCGKCGRRLYTRTEIKDREGKNIYCYYRCSGLNREVNACDFPVVRQDALETVVWDHFQKYLKSPALIYDALTLAYEEQDKHRTAKATEESQIQRKLDALEKEEKNIIRAFYGDRAGLDQDSFEGTVEEIRQERGLLRQRLQEIADTTLPTIEELASLPSLQEALGTFTAEIDAWTWEMKREALELLLDHVTVETDLTLTIRCKLPLEDGTLLLIPSRESRPAIRLFQIRTAPIERISRLSPKGRA